MNTRRIIAAGAALVLCLSLAPLSAEEEPEIAYRVLSGYVSKKEATGANGSRTAGLIVGGMGGLLVAGAATTWFAGDSIAQSTGTSFDPELKANLSIGLGIGGLVLCGVGTGLLLEKRPDYRSEYAEVFKETDPKVREALAAAVLRDLAIKGEKKRVSGAISTLLVPLISAGVRVGINLSNGNNWSDGVFSSISWSVWSVAGGIADLFGTSEEERLYERYLAGRAAIYGEPAGK